MENSLEIFEKFSDNKKISVFNETEKKKRASSNFIKIH